MKMETPDFQLDTVCSLDSIQACSIPVSRNSLTALLYDFYLALIGLVAYFVLRPLGIALLIFCALAALVALGLQIWRLILRRKLRPIRTAGWQYLEASLAFYPDRVELDQWNGKGLHVTIPYARVTAVLLTEDLLLIQGGRMWPSPPGPTCPRACWPIWRPSARRPGGRAFEPGKEENRYGRTEPARPAAVPRTAIRRRKGNGPGLHPEHLHRRGGHPGRHARPAAPVVYPGLSRCGVRDAGCGLEHGGALRAGLHQPAAPAAHRSHLPGALVQAPADGR